MAKSGNPFLDMDFGQMTDFSKMLEQWKVPGFDPQQAMEAQRKNLEAIANANRVAIEGSQALARRQAEILQQTMQETSRVMQELAAAGAPEERMAKQAEIAQRAFETAIANMRELAEMSAKSNAEAMEMINNRVGESLDEIRSLLQSMAEEARAKQR